MEVDYKKLCIDLFGTDKPDQLKKISDKTQHKSKSGRKPVLSEDDKNEICRLRSEGMQTSSIAKKFGVSRQVISKVLNPPMTEGCTMRMKYTHKNHICTIIDVDFANQRVKIYNRTDDMLMRAFGVIEEPTWDDLLYFMESRCYERTRGDIKQILKLMNIDSYDVFQIAEKTHGRTADDNMRIDFENRSLE